MAAKTRPSRRRSHGRWVRDPATPLVMSRQEDAEGKVRFRVAPIGRPKDAVTFELNQWQVSQMVREIRRVTRFIATIKLADARRWERIVPDAPAEVPHG